MGFYPQFTNSLSPVTKTGQQIAKCKLDRKDDNKNQKVMPENAALFCQTSELLNRFNLNLNQGEFFVWK